MDVVGELQVTVNFKSLLIIGNKIVKEWNWLWFPEVAPVYWEGTG